MSERVACVLCERTFGSIEALERHETKRHPAEPPAPQDGYQARANEETLAARAVLSSLRTELEALAETMARVEALALELGHGGIEKWAHENAETAARWARGI